MTDETLTTTARSLRSTEPPKRSKSRGHSALLFLRDILFILLAAIVISFLIKTFLIRSFYIPSESMENTLVLNDRVIVSLLTPGLPRSSTATSSSSQVPGGWLKLRTADR